MIFHLFIWHFDINWYKFEKRCADVFQVFKSIHFNPPQFCPSFPLPSFPVFCLSSSIVLSRYFAISVNSMTTWSMLKLPKIAWPSLFKQQNERPERSERVFEAIFQAFLAAAYAALKCDDQIHSFALFSSRNVVLRSRRTSIAGCQSSLVQPGYEFE